MNPSWPKWIISSVYKHFDARKASVKLYFDYSDRTHMKEEDHSEVRVDIPVIEKTAHESWDILVEINVIVDSVEDHKDGYRALKYAGIMGRCFTDQIPIRRYGDELDDDGMLLDCLTLLTELSVNNLGRIDDETGVYRIELDAVYGVTLTGPQSFRKKVDNTLTFNQSIIGVKIPA